MSKDQLPPLTGNRVFLYGFVIAVSLGSIFLPLVILTPMANEAPAWRSLNGPRFLNLDGMNIGGSSPDRKRECLP